MKWIAVATNYVSLISTCAILQLIEGAINSNFACCGGCSSSVRSDANVLSQGSRIFLWDASVKANPAFACTLTFPGDAALGELSGARRVRSGKLVGIEYALDHDYDQLCCYNNGECLLSPDDASGKCGCVKPWGFTGDHCENSVYYIANVNNTAVFPNITNITYDSFPITDLRGPYNMQNALQEIGQINTSSTAIDFNTSIPITELTNSYRRYAYIPLMMSILLAGGIVALYLLYTLWFLCVGRCICQSRYRNEKQTVYSKWEKIWPMVVCLTFSLAVCTGLVIGYLKIQNMLHCMATIKQLTLYDLPNGFEAFTTNLVEPFKSLAVNATSAQLFQNLQSKVSTQMRIYASQNRSGLNQLFQNAIQPLSQYSSNFPIYLNSTRCNDVTIIRSTASVMEVGALTGCFQCSTCSHILPAVQSIQTQWNRNAYKVLQALSSSYFGLVNFQNQNFTLLSNFASKIDQTRASFYTQHAIFIKAHDIIEEDAFLVLKLGISVLLGTVFFGLSLNAASAYVGFRYERGMFSRLASTITLLSSIAGCFTSGGVWTISELNRDIVDALNLFQTNTSVLFPRPTTSNDIYNILYDQSLVKNHSLLQLLDFADNLRIPPLPTPTDSNPQRYNMSNIFRFQDLDDIYIQYNDTNALQSLFGFSDTYVIFVKQLLLTLVFGNTSVVSPYNSSLDYYIMNTTVASFMDPDNDMRLVTAQDELFIQSQYNRSWSSQVDSVAQNQNIFRSWKLVASMYYYRIALKDYVRNVTSSIENIGSILDTLRVNTSVLESLEYQFNTDINSLANIIRAFKLSDCTYNGNCVWFRAILNELSTVLVQLINTTDFVLYCILISSGLIIINVVLLCLFGKRIEKIKVKVYALK